MRWLPRSLHARMLVLSAAATVLALAIAGWIMASVLERFVVAGLDRRLDSEVALLATAVGTDGRIDRDRVRQQLGALDDGRDWRWQIAGPAETVGSTDFPLLAAPGPVGPHAPPAPGLPNGSVVPPPLDRPPQPDRLQPVEGAAADGEAVHARRLVMRTTGGPVTITASAPRHVVRRPLRAAITSLLLVLASLGGLLGALTLLQLRLGLRPLRRLRDQVAAIRTGGRQSIDEDQPSELQPLATELNALTRENAAALATARLSATNLAHALKTPVAALALDLRDEPVRAAQVARIDDTIRHHLARARSQSVDRRVRTPIAPALADLVETVTRIHREKLVTITQDLPTERLTIAMDPRDLDELLGNLLDNAAKAAAARITVRAWLDRDPRFVRVDLCDDGPGIPASDRARAARPGVRLDEQADGHGFGLAIAVDLVALYGGTLGLNEASGGGLCVQLRLPGGADP